MTKAEKILEKHLVGYDTTSYTEDDKKLKQCYLNAINEALSIHVVSASNLDNDEEIWCANQYLTDRNVPTIKNGKELSLVGRIIAYQKMTHDDAYLH